MYWIFVARTITVGKRPKRRLRVAGLFAGVGGSSSPATGGAPPGSPFESNEEARDVLRKRFKGISLRGCSQTKAPPRQVDLVTAGFPCQDLSQAGQTAGLKGGQSGLVWEAFRLIESRHNS